MTNQYEALFEYPWHSCDLTNPQNDACMATDKSQATLRLAKPCRKWSDNDGGILTQAILCRMICVAGVPHLQRNDGRGP